MFKMELHATSDLRVIKRLLIEDKVDINVRNDIGETPLHTLVRKAAGKKTTKAFECLWTFLVYCNKDFNIDVKSDQHGDTALHIAVESNDLKLVEALVVFDADVNSLNITKMSPMDHAYLHKNEEMVELLQTRGALDGPTLRKRLKESEDSGNAKPVKLTGSGLPTLNVRQGPSLSPGSLGETPLELSIEDGQRILCLDGGGLRGLVLIEVLIYIENLTGKKIVELFDWIVGTSTGGIIALALVYAKKSLQELKQLFFQLKDDVFGTAKFFGYGCNTDKLAEILRSYFGEEMKLTAVTEPKVCIPAVDCRKTDLKLVFFNNCFYDGEEKYMDVLVWKAARYTSAAPVYFEPEDGYIDGGIKANNPTDYAFTRIQKYFDVNDQALKDSGKLLEPTKYACVVSVGCGVFQADELGDFSIQKYSRVGTHTLTFHRIFGELKNLLNLLGNAISNEEEIAESCRLRCEKQDVPFYRFCPAFDGSADIQVPTGETDARKLCKLILKTQSCLTTVWDIQIHRLANLLERVEKSRTQKYGFQY